MHILIDGLDVIIGSKTLSFIGNGFISITGDVWNDGISFSSLFVNDGVEIVDEYVVDFLIRARRLLNHVWSRLTSIFKRCERFSRVVTSGYCVWEKNCSRISICSVVNDERQRRAAVVGGNGKVSLSELSASKEK